MAREKIRNPKQTERGDALLNRRSFLKGMVGSSVIAAAGSLAISSVAGAAANARDNTGRWSEILDIVVVGSGFAGLAAATEAAERGMKVVVLEKMPRYGGNSAICHGEFAASDDPYHLRDKLELGDDGPARHAEDMLRAGNYYGKPDLVRVVAEQAPAALTWLLEGAGVKIQESVLAAPGHSSPRIYSGIGGSGEVLVEALKKRAEQSGVVIRTNEQVTAIWRNSFSAPVVGVEVQRGKRRSNIYIRQALILASGGFSRDLAMRQVYNPAVGSSYQSTNHPGATGELIQSARVVGADVTQMNFVQVYPFADPVTGRFDVPSVFALRGPAVGMIFVDEKGKRFVNEAADGETCARAQIRAGGKKRVTFALFNEAMISAMGTNDEIVSGMKAGRFARGETLADLARFLEIPPENLEKTVSDHNRYIREGVDPVWGKKSMKRMIPLESGPFYVLSQWPAVHGTLGGLRINTRAQVLDIRSNPIPRLYAAGEVTGGIHGANRLPGNSIPECIVFGRIAGANAAAEKFPA